MYRYLYGCNALIPLLTDVSAGLKHGHIGVFILIAIWLKKGLKKYNFKRNTLDALIPDVAPLVFHAFSLLCFNFLILASSSTNTLLVNSCTLSLFLLFVFVD